jgi:hypothetical protein
LRSVQPLDLEGVALEHFDRMSHTADLVGAVKRRDHGINSTRRELRHRLG